MQIPAVALFVLWMLFQAAIMCLQLSGEGSVSALAHVGGAVVGTACFLWVRIRTGGRFLGA